MTPPSELTVVGRGRVGGSLTAAAEASGLQVRDGAAAILLCVPDGAIEDACRDLLENSRPELVGHVSGACDLGVLSPASNAGVKTFSMHPLQTFPGPDTTVAGTPCAVAGSDEESRRFARDLATRLGMQPFEVPEESRAAYHAAASIASNFLIAIEEAAVELLERSGIEGGRELLSPLVLRSAANWSESGADALTGPIARGDAETIARHREAIERVAPEIVPLYDQLADQTERVAYGNRSEVDGRRGR